MSNKILFRYQENLKLLQSIKLIQLENVDRYICPICLEPHDEKDLTLEDAPQKSLGGTANTLTCKICNNEAGHKIDHHLTSRLNELDDAQFMPNSEIPVRVIINGDVLQATLKIDNDGLMTIDHSIRNNNPNKLEKSMDMTQSGDIVDIEFVKKKVIPDNLEFALLKTAYILFFEKFGYAFILDPCYDVVRKQIREPENRIFPEGFWVTPPNLIEIKNGVYFICKKGLECVLVLFNVRTDKTERKFGVFLPIPNSNYENVLKEIRHRVVKEKEYAFTLFPENQNRTDYLKDKCAIKQLSNWIQNINS